MNLLEPRRGVDAAVSARIKTWAREVWDLPAETGLTVTELACSEPGCPPRETVILLSPAGDGTEQRKLAKAAAAVTRADLASLASTPPASSDPKEP